MIIIQDSPLSKSYIEVSPGPFFGIFLEINYQRKNVFSYKNKRGT